MQWLTRHPLILALAILKFLLPFVLVEPGWELHRDELLYYQQGQHLSAGYLENPPLIGLLASVSSLAGGSVFSIKFWPALIGALTLLLTASLAGELGGGAFAKTIAALGIFFSAFMRIHYLFQPNILDIFFWLLAAYFLARYINRSHPRELYFLFLSLALGWWSKYSIIFFIAAIAISILLTTQRDMIWRRHFWLAALAALVLVLPNLAWQYLHHWPVLHHMEELRDTQLRHISAAGFLKEQLLLLLPVLFVWLGGLAWLLYRQRYRVLGYMYLAVVALLILSSGKGYYALGAYPMLLAAGGVWLEKISVQRLWLRFAATAVILAASLPMVPLLLPVQPPAAMARFNKEWNIKEAGLLKWEDQAHHPLQQDFADMRGWKEMTLLAERFFDSLGDSIKTETLVYCRNYGQAGALKYYSRSRQFREKVFGDNGSFLLWIPPRLDFKHLLFIGEDIPGTDDEVFNHFARRELVGTVRDSLSRSFGTKVLFYRQADSSAVRLAATGLREKKKKFNTQ